MSTGTVTLAHQGLVEALEGLRATMSTGAGDDELFAVLRSCAAVMRRAEVICVETIGTLARRGGFSERGYRSIPMAVAELMGCEPFEACRRVIAAEQVRPRVGLDGGMLPPGLPATATAAVFESGHADAIARESGID